MMRFTPEFHRLAQALLALERVQGDSAADNIRACQSACQKLSQYLTQIIGIGGVQVLFQRALNLVQADVPLLAPVRMEMTSEVQVVGMEESLLGQSKADVDLALTSLLAEVLWLLSTLIGPDLMWNQVRWLWPRYISEASDAGSHEACG